MKAMLLAAGEGTRLRPLTLEMPKVLLPIGGQPLIEYQLSWLKHHGIQEVAINLYHLGNKVKDFLGDGSRFGVKIFYSTEEKLLGTAGGVKRMEHLFHNTFVVVYADVLTNFNLSAMVKFHQEKKAAATLVIFEAPNPTEVGVVEMSPAGRILSFVEKPKTANLERKTSNLELQSLASGGVYVLEKEVLNYIPAQGFSDFAYDIFPKLLELSLPIYGYALKSQDYLIDIGTIEKYNQANKDVLDLEVLRSMLDGLDLEP
ncbi:UTP--glucose-1-phosphate uridylyltransferase [subsurface metagenome]